MPDFNKKNSVILKIIPIIIVILLAIGSFWYSSRTKTKPQEVVKLSPQQQELVDKFGYPTTFVLSFGEEFVSNESKFSRHEIWNYNHLGRRFRFVDGEFKAAEDMLPLKDAKYPQLHPSMFENDLTFDEVKKITQAQPTAISETDPELLEGAKTYNFAGQLIVGEHEDKVVFIQTFPVTGEIELDTEELKKQL